MHKKTSFIVLTILVLIFCSCNDGSGSFNKNNTTDITVPESLLGHYDVVSGSAYGFDGRYEWCPITSGTLNVTSDNFLSTYCILFGSEHNSDLKCAISEAIPYISFCSQKWTNKLYQMDITIKYGYVSSRFSVSFENDGGVLTYKELLYEDSVLVQGVDMTLTR